RGAGSAGDSHHPHAQGQDLWPAAHPTPRTSRPAEAPRDPPRPGPSGFPTNPEAEEPPVETRPLPPHFWSQLLRE
uniref:Uncharacterized protein n=1 Tax=Otolemur garnettii TaxID=30611 RepID=H0XSF9_OTOGA